MTRLTFWSLLDVTDDGIMVHSNLQIRKNQRHYTWSWVYLIEQKNTREHRASSGGKQSEANAIECLHYFCPQDKVVLFLAPCSILRPISSLKGESLCQMSYLSIEPKLPYEIRKNTWEFSAIPARLFFCFPGLERRVPVSLTASMVPLNICMATNALKKPFYLFYEALSPSLLPWIGYASPSNPRNHLDLPFRSQHHPHPQFQRLEVCQRNFFIV